MNVFGEYKKYLKSAFKPFFNLDPIPLISGLLNEILCILVAQETAKLPYVKVGDLKKNSAAQPTQMLPCSNPRFFFQTSNFDL